MGGASVIDNFLGVFTRYIDSGFGLLSGEVAFIATTLIVIDVTLAALFWSWGADDDIMARLVKKTLFVGVFAYLIGNWNNLAKIVFDSFAGLGLKASGTGFSAQDLMRPGKVAQTGLDAARRRRRRRGHRAGQADRADARTLHRHRSRLRQGPPQDRLTPQSARSRCGVPQARKRTCGTLHTAVSSPLFANRRGLVTPPIR